ncbi:MAG: glycosyltransferase, partial [Acidobacteriota bacterium]|nr:glycosyltransferase [Acidobacteriota bacterium]
MQDGTLVSAPMRFCMMTTFYPPYSFGGDAVFVQALSNLLVERGHQVDVIHCIDSYYALGGSRPAASTQPENPALTIHGLSSPFKWLSPLATQQTGHPLFKAAEIRRILSAGNFDVIHFHNVSLIGGPALLGYGEALKLYTIHEHWLLCPMHTLFRDNREPCEEKKCIRCALNYHRPPQLWRYTNAMREAVRHVDAFLAPTDFSRELHLASGLPMNIVTLPNFHDPRHSIHR